MAKRANTGRKRPSAREQSTEPTTLLSSSVDEMLLAALQRGDDSGQTGRFIATMKEDAADEGMKSMAARGLRVADARDFTDQSFSISDVGDADAVYFPEIGVAILGGEAATSRSMMAAAAVADDSPIAVVEPEYFVFADGAPDAYLRGFLRAAEVISRDLADTGSLELDELPMAEIEASGATWGLVRCKVPPSAQSGSGIRVAVLDTGFDPGHPDFAGRIVVSQSFVGLPVQDLHGHGTHCIGTACGPMSPAKTTQRYGIAYHCQIYVGKVLSNSGSSVGGSVLAGMNWAIANKCAVISMSLGSQSPPQAAYTAAGRAALRQGSLIIAAAGNSAAATGAPANSPTILSVASLDPTLAPSSFSNFGKIEIAAPGRDVYSSVPRPTLYGVKSGTSMATPHVAGCAALWAQTSPSLRGRKLWEKLCSSARPLSFPATRVGSGLVQAP